MNFCLDIHGCFGQWMKNLCNTLVRFNLYRNPLQVEPNHIKSQIWSTRLYIGLLASALFILALYSSVTVGIKIIEVDHPSLDVVQTLEKKQYSLTCPCAVLSIKYEYLFQLTPVYHQICTSAFVEVEWINYFNTWFTLTFNTSIDITPFQYGSSRFQLLRALCDLSNRTVSDAIFQFGKTQLITSELLPVDLFSKQINSAIQQFKQTLPNNILRLVQLLRNITNINQFMTIQGSNFGLFYSRNQPPVLPTITLASSGFESLLQNGSSAACFCANNSTCQTDSGIQVNGPMNTDPLTREPRYYPVSHFYTGCNPVESLLPSTLECLYDRGIFMRILHDISNTSDPIIISPLNSSMSSRFSVEATIEDLFTNLFVELWSTTLLYSSYFNQCQPIVCSYPIQERKSPLEIVTTIASLIGGLSTIFKFLSPYLISLLAYITVRYRQRRRQRDIVTHQGKTYDAEKVRIQFLHFVGENRNILTIAIGLSTKVRAILWNLNIFGDVNNPSIDENQIYIERQSTRLYFISLFMTTIILVVSTSLIYRTNEVNVDITSIEGFVRFYQSHNSILVNCSCTQLSSIRSAFWHIEPKFHAMCSSDFIQDRWLNLLFSTFHNHRRSVTDNATFSGTAFGYFQAMSIMCNLARQAVIDARDLFLATLVVTSQMPTLNLFHLNINSTFEDFQSSLSNSFIHNLQLFRGLSQGSGLVSVYNTNWSPFLVKNITLSIKVYMQSQSYGGCDCAVSSSCIQNSTPIIAGYFVGCLPLESYLRSTLECLSSQSCLDQISSAIASSYIPPPLSITESRFAIKTLNNDIVDELFIESWSSNASYEQFFEECQPKACMYRVAKRNNPIYVITTLLGLLGGINILLRLFIPPIMSQISQCINRFHPRNRQVVPIN